MTSAVRNGRLQPSGPTDSPRRHPDLYFATGDVILSANGDDAKYLFCVHMTVLSHHSPIFQDMFALPVNADTNETHDGLPVVHLYDDFADVDKFLRALYNFG